MYLIISLLIPLIMPDISEPPPSISELEERIDVIEARLERLENELEGEEDVEAKMDEPTTIQAEATFYTAFCPTGCTGITATGVDVSNTIYYEGKRIIAVDPNVIPLGSHVRVTLKDGTSFEALALDTGGAIKGNRIDVLVASRDEAYKLGRQSAKVEILRWGG